MRSALDGGGGPLWSADAEIKRFRRASRSRRARHQSIGATLGSCAVLGLTLSVASQAALGGRPVPELESAWSRSRARSQAASRGSPCALIIGPWRASRA